MSTRRVTATMALIIVTLAVAACGKGGGSKSSSASAAPTHETVQARKTALGQVLANADGHTLYMFMKDAAGISSCTGACAQTWPPLTATVAPTAGPGADVGKLATIMRDDGTKQVTYAGSPLYAYSKDDGAGDTYGQGVGGVWFAAGPDGKPVTTAAATTSTSAPGSSY